MSISIKKAQENLGYSKSPWMYMRKGRYYSEAVTAYVSTIALAGGYLFASPFIVSKRFSFDRIWIEVTTAGAAGALAGLGVYTNTSDTYPGNLILDAGTVGTDTTGVKEIAIDLLLPPDLYWLALSSSGAPVLRAVSTYSCLGFMIGSSGAGAAPPGTMYRATFAFAPLPNPFPAGATVLASNPIYLQLRRK